MNPAQRAAELKEAAERIGHSKNQKVSGPAVHRDQDAGAGFNSIGSVGGTWRTATG
jgi:hypothetical protein